MAKQTIQIDLINGLRTTIGRPVREIKRDDDMRLGEITIFDKPYLVRYAPTVRQWRLCDSNGQYLRAPFNPADLKETQ